MYVKLQKIVLSDDFQKFDIHYVYHFQVQFHLNILFCTDEPKDGETLVSADEYIYLYRDLVHSLF